MKKIYLSLLAISVAGVSFAQHAIKTTNVFRTSENDVIKTTKQHPQDKGAQLWFDDFSNSANWYMTSVGATTKNWTIGQSATGNGGFPLADIQSTSGTPFALFDADDASSGASFDASITTVNPISTLGNPNVSLVFESYFRPFSTTAVYVEVSTDSVNFTNSYQVHANIPVNGATANPELTTVNISAAAGNQPKVWIRFRYTGSWDYGWAVDDVRIEVTENNDLFGHDFYYGTAGIPYTRVPASQVQPVDFFMRVDNVGAADQTNTIMTADVNGSTVGTSTPQTVLAGASNDSLGMTAVWTPPASPFGVPYNITLTATSDSVDSTPLNNAGAFMPLEVSSDLYAHDDFGANGYNIGGGYNTQATPPTEEFEAGNWFDIFSATNGLSIDVVIGSSTQAGAIIDAVLYDVSTGSFVEVPNTRTSPYTVTAGDISSNATITLQFPQPASLTAGNTYFAAVHAWGGTGAEFYYATSGTSLDGQGFGAQQSLIFYPSMANPNSGENFYTTQTPTVRLRVSPTISVEDVNADNIKFNVFPNPSKTGEFTINLNTTNTENVNLMVTNVVGQTVVNKTIAVSGQTKETISLADFSKGVYFLTVNNETVKLIVE